MKVVRSNGKVLGRWLQDDCGLGERLGYYDHIKDRFICELIWMDGKEKMVRIDGRKRQSWQKMLKNVQESAHVWAVSVSVRPVQVVHSGESR
jgi:hypothetical protein